jgi:hypothetical protein
MIFLFFGNFGDFCGFLYFLEFFSDFSDFFWECTRIFLSEQPLDQPPRPALVDFICVSIFLNYLLDRFDLDVLCTFGFVCRRHSLGCKLNSLCYQAANSLIPRRCKLESVSVHAISAVIAISKWLLSSRSVV